MRRQFPTRPLRPLFALALLAILGAACQEADPELGPADGADLLPVDTGRVAVGDTAPDFTLLDRHGEPVTLSDLRGRRIVLVFYRGFW
mgnify:CR=1 FL=1